ncbi:MAG: MBL fold metallo-hydrolase [Actinobacteria bacterium]|nr:MBL fold metallo-hydrolase [Actinomycetota bacterium]
MNNPIPASFAHDDSLVGTGRQGQRAHQQHLAHGERLEKRLYAVTDQVWCMVGNGLSNQTFVEGPEGLIAIDTGESVEEMAEALRAVRAHTSAPLVAVIYTHFHYCSGTQAVFAEAEGAVPVWAHHRVESNLQAMGGELGPSASRGLVHQFSIVLPEEGPDALTHVGLGLSYRQKGHAPFTSGFVAPTHLITEATSTVIAGLRVEITLAPSDADDNITIFFPELSVCVNNLVWPALFNVFAIRGEAYRDPQILLRGLDEILALEAEYLVGAHGPPLVGVEEIRAGVTDGRDALQYLWDQTVRGVNKGLTDGELISFVQLPEFFGRSYLTQQNYGLAEHHVRQISQGLTGWFDGLEASLFPLPTAERCCRLIEGFGGRTEVARQAEEALGDNDLRWALELATWLVRSEVDASGRADAGSSTERALLASVLRALGQRTTSANIRGWCLTRALELDDQLDLSRFRMHRFGRRQVLTGDPVVFIQSLRVLLDPIAAANVEGHLRWCITDGPTTGLLIRHQVAVPTDGQGADLEVALSHAALADLLSRKVGFSDAVAAGTIRVSGDLTQVTDLLACFELASMRS